MKKRVNTLVGVKESPTDFFSLLAQGASLLRGGEGTQYTTNATSKVGAASAKKCPGVHRRVPTTSSFFWLKVPLCSADFFPAGAQSPGRRAQRTANATSKGGAASAKKCPGVRTAPTKV